MWSDTASRERRGERERERERELQDSSTVLHTYHCEEEQSLEVVVQACVGHPTVVVEEKNILDIKLAMLKGGEGKLKIMA